MLPDAAPAGTYGNVDADFGNPRIHASPRHGAQRGPSKNRVAIRGDQAAAGQMAVSHFSHVGASVSNVAWPVAIPSS